MPSGHPDEDESRMSFFEHLTELRARLLKALLGLAVAYAISLTFTDPLWRFVCRPAAQALQSLGYPPQLYVFDPMDAFQIIWVKLPIVWAIFLASPWVLYQLWAFLAPGLYRHERRWVGPVLVGSSALFIAGGIFAYFVVFRYGLTFLLSIGKGNFVVPMVSMDIYFERFVDVVLGVGVLFELPVVIFLLTALGVVTPGFLIRHSRYAILAVFLLAAVITPSSDVFNLMLFAIPMCVLFFAGVFASYLLTLRRQGRSFPWRPAIWIAAGMALAGGGAWTFYQYRHRRR
jgi:sec-independent protein translocase protein TatC